MTSVLLALASALFAALLGFTAQAGLVALVGAVALGVLAVALGWGMLLKLPDPGGTAVVIAVSGWAAAGVAYLTSARTQPLSLFAPMIATAVLLAFAHELARRDRRPRLVESVTGTLVGQVVAVLGAGWVLLPTTRLAASAVVVPAVAAGVTAALLAVPLDLSLRTWIAAGAGVGAAGVAAVATAPNAIGGSLEVGAVVAAAVAGMSVLARAQETTRSPLALLSAAAAPLVAAGTIAFAVARLTLGAA